MRFLALILFVLTSLFSHAQHYRFHQYRVEQGLPSDVIKAVTQDSLGFFWIATDDGLVKYDGLKFTTYKSAFRSQYAKGFLHTQKGKLLAYSDLDLIEIDNRIDTVIFRSVLRGERYVTDSTLWLPKSIYQSRDGEIWLGEPKSIVRYNGKSIKRYDMGEENRSPVFIRSFSFFEDKRNQLYAVSYSGKLFRYNKARDAFEEDKAVKFPEDVRQVLFYMDRLLIASRNGLYAADFQNYEVKSVTNIFPIRNVSNFLLTPDSTVLVSTYDEDLYQIYFEGGLVWENMYYNFNGINSCFVSKDRDIWVASDKGVILVQKNLFVLADINSQAHFVEGIAHDALTDVIYYCTKETVVRLSPTTDGEWERNVLAEHKDNYFQSLQFGKLGLWASSGADIILFQNDRVARKWNFSKEGNMVNDLFLDSRGNLWISQTANSWVNVITDSLTIMKFEVPELRQNEINIIREGREGMYAGASGAGSYLFFKASNSPVFKNISPTVNFEVRGDFNVVDLVVHNEVVWLASTEGLLRYDQKELTRIDLGEGFADYPVSSIESLDNDNILFSNSFGLFRYNVNTGEHWVFDENSGLPSNTITDHGILVTKNRDVWIGTSYGLAYAIKSLVANKITPKPYCVEARVNGVPSRFMDGLHAPYGSFITLQFSPISFPENKINLQWRKSNEARWRAVESRQFSLSQLDAGTHTIFVRAKKNTGLGWSEPTRLNVIVANPYWRQPQFFFMIFLGVVFIAWGSYAISSAIMNQRKKFLQQQIHERTQELQNANEELTLRNTELDRFVYSASHDLSAPLKSILGLIQVAKMDEPGDMHNQYLTMMERSVNKLEEFIKEVVSYSRNTRMPVKWEAFQFKDFVYGLLQDHEFAPNFKHIEFMVQDNDETTPMVSDVTRIKIILNNLLSNAIKFHWVDNGRKPVVNISLKRGGGQYVLMVEDNGRGIPEHHINRIFEMFYRATDETQGSGLGLYILKESVLKLGGRVEALSQLEKGTTFKIYLPIPEPVSEPVVGL